jgi:peptidoglycan/xylan/chitin deacetylase (PgdA/CDA1 family)
MYHYVRPIKGSRYPSIKGLELDSFKRQLDYLEQNFNLIKADTLIEHVKGKPALPANACLLTFDDGYKDHYLHVLPELKRRGLYGSFFPPVKPVKDGKVLDVNKIHFILSEQPDIKILINDLRTMLSKSQCNFDSNTDELKSFEFYWDEYAKPSRFDSKEIIFFKRMLQHILPDDVRSNICNILFQRYVCDDQSDFASQLYMSVDEVKELVHSGMYVGSHGYQHIWLNKETRDNQFVEIDSSLKFLADIGAPTKDWVMCYPYGGYNADTLDILSARSCCLGLTTKAGLAELRSDALLELPRFDTNEFPQ